MRLSCGTGVGIGQWKHIWSSSLLSGLKRNHQWFLTLATFSFQANREKLIWILVLSFGKWQRNKESFSQATQAPPTMSKHKHIGLTGNSEPPVGGTVHWFKDTLHKPFRNVVFGGSEKGSQTNGAQGQYMMLPKWTLFIYLPHRWALHHNVGRVKEFITCRSKGVLNSRLVSFSV